MDPEELARLKALGLDIQTDTVEGLHGTKLDAPPPPQALPRATQAESAAAGVGQGASLGYSDEIAAGLQTADDQYLGGAVQRALGPPGGPAWEGTLDPSTGRVRTGPPSYRERLLAARERMHQAQRDNPGVYQAAELAGSVPSTAAVPIPSGSAAPMARVAQMAATGGTIGTVSGAGHSERDDAAGVIEDAAVSGLTGMGVGALTEMGVQSAGAAFSAAARGLGNAASAAGRRVFQWAAGIPDVAAAADEQAVAAAGGRTGDLADIRERMGPQGVARVAEQVRARGLHLPPAEMQAQALKERAAGEYDLIHGARDAFREGGGFGEVDPATGFLGDTPPGFGGGNPRVRPQDVLENFDRRVGRSPVARQAADAGRARRAVSSAYEAAYGVDETGRNIQQAPQAPAGDVEPGPAPPPATPLREQLAPAAPVDPMADTARQARGPTLRIRQRPAVQVRAESPDLPESVRRENNIPDYGDSEHPQFWPERTRGIFNRYTGEAGNENMRQIAATAREARAGELASQGLRRGESGAMHEVPVHSPVRNLQASLEREEAATGSPGFRQARMALAQETDRALSGPARGGESETVRTAMQANDEIARMSGARVARERTNTINNPVTEIGHDLMTPRGVVRRVFTRGVRRALGEGNHAQAAEILDRISGRMRARGPQTIRDAGESAARVHQAMQQGGATAAAASHFSERRTNEHYRRIADEENED